MNCLAYWSRSGILYRKSSKLEMGSYEIGELDQALFMYLDGQQDYPASTQEHRREFSKLTCFIVCIILNYLIYLYDTGRIYHTGSSSDSLLELLGVMRIIVSRSRCTTFLTIFCPIGLEI